jgi:polysaccharide deacetylase family protein (PEP-CTERM system associated)
MRLDLYWAHACVARFASDFFAMKNVLSFDLEDYYHVSAFETGNREKWGEYQSRVVQSTQRVLAMLDHAACKATFFTLGWVAENYPELIREIDARGHEVACHSDKHRRVFEMSGAEFREDTRVAKTRLEQIIGQAIIGYRAPSFSITGDSLWAFEILAELGFRYDSSIFPVDHPNYGMRSGPRTPFRVPTASGPIVEFPMPTLEIGRARSPIGGGAYLRLLPYWYTRWGLRFVNAREGQPICVYVHPWEIDAEQPRMKGSVTARMRHYLGLRGLENKLRGLLRDFEFQTMGALIAEMESSRTSGNGLREIPLEQLQRIADNHTR